VALRWFDSRPVRSSMSGQVRRSQLRMWPKIQFSITTTTTVLTGECISCF
jgi:hypothetical protein